MKNLTVLTALIISFTSYAQAPSAKSTPDTDIYKKHRTEIHEAEKKWDLDKTACKSKFKNWNNKQHPDFDSHFTCMEEVYSNEKALQNKQRKELCDNGSVTKCDPL